MFRFISTNTTGVRQTFGKFTGLSSPGLTFYIPIIQEVTPVSNRIREESFNFRVKTKDDTFVDIGLKIQFQVKAEDSGTAFFSLDNAESQIESYIENTVRSIIPRMSLNEVYETRHDICDQVSKELSEKIRSFGYTLRNTLVTDVTPTKEVMDAMNRVKASERLLIAAKNEADAHYIKEIRQAEADRDRKILQGEGISGQRLAILKGYEESVQKMMNAFSMGSSEILQFIVRCQELDTMEAIGRSTNTKTLFFGQDKPVVSDVIKAREVQ